MSKTHAPALPGLFEPVVVDPASVPFDGATFEPAKDSVRLAGLLARVKALMSDGRWRTLAEIRAVVGGTEASVSARLRDLRKPKFGGHTVETRRRDGGLWESRLHD